MILENDSGVEKWFKLAKGQFQIFFRHAHHDYQYEPDFAVETKTEKLIVEIKAKKHMLGRHYPLSGHALESPSSAGRLLLFLTNKMFKWRFACQRYGLFNVAMRGITRRINRPLYAIFVRRIDVIATKHLK